MPNYDAAGPQRSGSCFPESYAEYTPRLFAHFWRQGLLWREGAQSCHCLGCQIYRSHCTLRGRKLWHRPHRSTASHPCFTLWWLQALGSQSAQRGEEMNSMQFGIQFWRRWLCNCCRLTCLQIEALKSLLHGLWIYSERSLIVSRHRVQRWMTWEVSSESFLLSIYQDRSVATGWSTRVGSLQRSAMKFERGACKNACACAGARSLPRSCGSFGRWPHFMERRWHPNTVETSMTQMESLSTVHLLPGQIAYWHLLPALQGFPHRGTGANVQ